MSVFHKTCLAIDRLFLSIIGISADINKLLQLVLLLIVIIQIVFLHHQVDRVFVCHHIVLLQILIRHVIVIWKLMESPLRRIISRVVYCRIMSRISIIEARIVKVSRVVIIDCIQSEKLIVLGEALITVFAL